MEELATAVCQYTQFLAVCKLLECAQQYSDIELRRATIETLKQIAEVKTKENT